jgi:raffinose/stachyose/melibiose transport system substrate-binding protein
MKSIVKNTIKNMVGRGALPVLAAALVALAAPLAAGQARAVELVIESWRSEDIAIWEDMIIPAFEASHPGITLRYAPTAPTEYNAALNARLEGGTAGDVITCRSFDNPLGLYDNGHLLDVTGLENMKHFSDHARSGWITDDGSAVVCLPMFSVIHGFIYNKDAFNELGLTPPGTVDEFFAVLDAIKADGTYIPLAMGTNDQWESGEMGYLNIGPNYWKGEEGRKALIAGDAKLTDEEFVGPFRQLARWSEYMGAGFEAQTYPDSQNLFTLGRAAIYPSGSWEIAGFRAQADFDMGAFPPPVPSAGDTCYICDHVDIGIGINASSDKLEAAKTFVNWVGSEEFVKVAANALPGFFPLSSHKASFDDPLSDEFASWRETCEETIRVDRQIVSRGTPNLVTETWTRSANVIRGTESPEEAAAAMQNGLASWYGPQQ